MLLLKYKRKGDFETMTTAILIVLCVYFGASVLLDASKADRKPCWSTVADVFLDLCLLVGVFRLMEVCL